VDKNLLLRAEPKRHRDKDHLRWLSTLLCLICGRKPAHADHLTYAQPRAMGSKTSDEFVIPLCSLHHRELHGNEREWWRLKNLDPIPIALGLWQQTRGKSFKSPASEAETTQIPTIEQLDPSTTNDPAYEVSDDR
jgi:hypothetical protein